ncbi:MAG: hypothetical protein QM762_04510 [Chryseolinea sp.]
MSLLYKASLKELARIRNKIFLDRGIPVLHQNGFRKSPFAGADFGWHPSMGFFYDLCRLSGANLEIVKAAMIRGDRWIQIRINIFELSPAPASLDQLTGLDGLQFYIPPNSVTEMRLHSDDIKGIALFSYDFRAQNHKLKSYFTKSGFERRANDLGNHIEKDLRNIDSFVRRWHELHKPMVTTWEGQIPGFDAMTVTERLEASRLLPEFEVAAQKDKGRARQILGWLKVDGQTIEQLVK